MTQLFKKKNFFLIFFINILYISLISFFWDLIKLPFSNNDEVVGYLTINKINSNNDTLRFFLFIGIPLLLNFFFVKNFNSKEFFNLKEFIITKEYKKDNLPINEIFLLAIIFFIYITLEFLSIDLSKFNYLDTLHDGDSLTPFINYLSYGGFWSVSFTIHGGRDIFIPILSHQILGLDNFAAVRFTELLFIFLIKFFSIVFSIQLLKFTNLDKNYKIIIFVLSTIFLLSLSSYNKNTASLEIRDLPVLIFFIFFSKIFFDKSNFFLTYILTLIVIIALLFHYDTGIYLFLVLLFYTFYLIAKKNIRDLLLIFLFSFINFFLLYYYLGPVEITNLYHQAFHIIKNIDKIHGLEYPRPFFSIGELKSGSRATKLLLFYFILNFFIIYSIFLKNKYLNTREKALILFMFLYALISFKNALGRADGPHMQTSEDWINIFLYYYFIFWIFIYGGHKINKAINKFNIFKIVSVVMIILMVYKFNNLKFYEYKSNLLKFINTPNSTYNDDETNNIIQDLKNLFRDDECINNFTTNLSLPYILGKPTCHKFFSSWIVSGKKTENLYLSYLRSSKSKHIIYEAPNLIVDGITTAKRLPIVNLYIKENFYEIYNNNNYIILRKIN